MQIVDKELVLGRMDIVEYAEEREKCLRELEQTEAQEIERAWNGLMELFEQSKELNEKRAEMLGELYQLSFGRLEVQYANLSETFRTQISDFDVQKARIYPIVHYRVLPNELVFDVDADDPDQAKEQLKILIESIEALGANPLVGFSGNRGYHVHLLIAPPGGISESFVANSATTQLRNMLWKWIAFQAKSNGLDLRVLDASIVRSQAHTIRAFYAFNPKGKNWKLPIKGTRYTDAIYIITKDLAAQLFSDLVYVQKFNAVHRIGTEGVRERPRYWLESILRHPERIGDGRKRILYHLLIPYLITEKKMSPDNVLKILTEWLERTGADVRKYQSWLKSNIRLTIKKQIKPMSCPRFVDAYPDLEKYVKNWYGDHNTV
jgi:hypothetical protein